MRISPAFCVNDNYLASSMKKIFALLLFILAFTSFNEVVSFGENISSGEIVTSREIVSSEETEKKNLTLTEEGKALWDTILSEESIKNKNLLYASFIAYKDMARRFSDPSSRDPRRTSGHCSRP